MAKNLITVKHAAERIDTSPMTVYRLIYAGLLRPHYIGLGKVKPRVRVADTDVTAYIEATAG